MNGGVYFIIKIFLKKQELKKCRKLLTEMKAVCEKLQAANITPFTAIDKDNWTVSQEFLLLIRRSTWWKR